VRRVLFLFLDGVGLGEADAGINPLYAGNYPTLMRLTGGVPLTRASGRVHTDVADLLPLDACMGVEGRPQSATGQAALLTGRNASAEIGEHYGPRPDDRVREVVRQGSLFSWVREAQLSAAFCNAYPPGFFAAVDRGKRLLSVIQFAVTDAGLRLSDKEDLLAGQSLSADYTNRSWKDQLGIAEIPVYLPEEAGMRFWQLARPHHFYFHDHWLTDLLGHRQDLTGAVADLEMFDGFLGGLLSASDLDETLIVVASDHGNVEDCSDRKHTLNPALCMLIGNRDGLPIDDVTALNDVAPIVLKFLGIERQLL
jgi:2,3-bisphosphoglycerate-independent phosphoglycerate mutase